MYLSSFYFCLTLRKEIIMRQISEMELREIIRKHALWIVGKKKKEKEQILVKQIL